MGTIIRRAAAFLTLAGLGVGVFVWLQHTGPKPRKRPKRERGRAVRTLVVQPVEAIPRVTGYGVVTAQRTWRAVAEVSGTIVYMSPQVEVGRRVDKGTVLFRIDPGSYKIEKSRSEATVRAVEAQIAELEAREKSANASLNVERRMLSLARKELKRVTALHKKGLTPLAQVEEAQKGVLTAEKAVRQLKNTLIELPASRKVLEAQLAQQKAGVENAAIDLAKTEVKAPFRMRISQIGATLHQAVSSGQVVVTGEGTNVMEIPAQIPVGSIGPLLAPLSRLSRQAESNPRATPAGSPPGAQPPPRQRPRRTSAITALINLDHQGVRSQWKGKFRRFQGVDTNTRTLGVVIEATRKPRAERKGPPLTPGLHVEVELRGAPRKQCLAIPRAAVRRNRVNVVGRKRKLEIREIETSLVQEEFVCVSKGLAAGDQVVLTELAPAVKGMLLSPRKDANAPAWLKAVARGEKPGT